MFPEQEYKDFLEVYCLEPETDSVLYLFATKVKRIRNLFANEHRPIRYCKFLAIFSVPIDILSLVL
jgi:hypothetical protein